MKTLLSPVRLSTIAALAFATALPARATSTHTWVSGIGNDANTGTQQSPYADFATAIANTTVGGVISVADSGDFGTLTITQSITIDGMPGATITTTASEAIYIQVPAGQTVIIRNLTIDGLGQGTDGIYFTQSSTTGTPATLIIQDCRIANFTDIGIGVGDQGPRNIVVRDTSIDGGSLGVRTFQSAGFVPYAHVHLNNVHISNASMAGVFTRNGTLDMRYCDVTDSLFGIENDTSAIVSADSCVFSNDGTAVNCFSSGVTRLSNDDFWDCGAGIAPA